MNVHVYILIVLQRETLKISLEFGGWGNYKKVKNIIEPEESVGEGYKRRKTSAFLVVLNYWQRIQVN